MKASPVKDIKNVLETSSHEELLQLCIRLIKFKKENKELASYLLFESSNESGYIQTVKDSLDILFEDINHANLYYVKKTLRKIIRVANRYIKYSEVQATEVEILLHVAATIHEMKLDFSKSAALLNLYNGLVKKIKTSMSAMHEDLQYDYQRQLEKLNNNG